MTATFTAYADFKTVLRSAFQTVSLFVYYFDDTAGSGNFYIWAIDWADKITMPVLVVGKPATFGADFPRAIQLMSLMVLS